MKRIFLFLLLTLPVALLLAGCGGGGGKRSASARSVGQLKITLALPAAIQDKIAGRSGNSALRASASSKTSAVSKPGSRVIPNNAVQVIIRYNSYNNNPVVSGGSVAIYKQVITGGVAPATITLNDVVAGAPNTISVELIDAPAPAISPIIASGSATVNIAPNVPNPPPGSTAPANEVNITLVSTVTGTITYQLDTNPPNPPTTNVNFNIGDLHTHTLRVVSITNTDGLPVTTIAPASLKWEPLDPNNLNVTQTPQDIINGTATIQQIRPGAPARVQLTYSEPENGNSHTVQTQTLTFNLSATLSSQAAQTLTQAGGLTNVPPANAYDVTENGYALYYDALRTTGLDANAGYSRIVQFALPAPFTLNSAVDFDTAAPPGPTYIGAGSKTAFFSEGGNSYWATVNASGSQIIALTAGQYRAGATPVTLRWTYTPSGGTTILDVDVKGGLVHLLESVGGNYQVETFAQNLTGAVGPLSVQLVLLTGIGFAPANVAVISSGGNVFDYYLNDATHIAKAHVVSGGVTSITPNFATLANIRDVATTTDLRFVYVLTTTSANVLSIVDGSLVASSGLTGGAVGRRLSAAGFGLGSSYVYALEDLGAISQIQGFALP